MCKEIWQNWVSILPYLLSNHWPALALTGGNFALQFSTSPTCPYCPIPPLALLMNVPCLPLQALEIVTPGEERVLGNTVGVGIKGESSSPFLALEKTTPGPREAEDEVSSRRQACAPVPGRLLRKRLSREAKAGAPVRTSRGNSENIFPGKANTAICFRCLNYMCYLFFKWSVIGEWGRHPASQNNQNFRYCKCSY